LHCHSPLDSKLGNISTHGFADTGDDVMIGPGLIDAGVAIEIPIFPRNRAAYLGQYPYEWPQMTPALTERLKRLTALRRTGQPC
jgi:hypothetical protein